MRTRPRLFASEVAKLVAAIAASADRLDDALDALERGDLRRSRIAQRRAMIAAIRALRVFGALEATPGVGTAHRRAVC